MSYLQPCEVNANFARDVMLDPQRLALALDIHSRSYRLLRWLGTAADDGLLPIERVERMEQHSDTPEAAIDWMVPYSHSGAKSPGTAMGRRFRDSNCSAKTLSLPSRR